MALHLLGRLVDGREILAIKIDAAPALSRKQVCEVLQSGADAISRGAYELVHINGVEVACKTAMPALWRESPSPDKETLCNSTKRS